MGLIEIINALRDTYNSIDIRVVAFKENASWYAAFVVIRFRRETVDELNKEHELSGKKNYVIEFDDFRVRYYYFPITEWKKI